jgi:hypothetical protein
MVSSLCRDPAWGTWRRGAINGDSKRHIKEGFGNAASGSMKGTWTKGSYTEDSEKHVI